jgi:ribonuclease G
MSKQLLINVTAGLTRTALVEDGLLQEVNLEKSNEARLVGNIYKGKVSRVMPGMQAAFVDIGEERAGFLHESDIPLLNQEGLDQDGLEQPGQEVRNNLSSIHDGKSLLVQVVKSPFGTKGARLSMRLSLSARYLVYMPQSNHLGISQRIENEEERERLKGLISDLSEQQSFRGGFIARTAAEGASSEQLDTDMAYLKGRWHEVVELSKKSKPPANIHADIPLALRAVRDISSSGLDAIQVDSKHDFESIKEFTSKYCPNLAPLVSHYQEPRPLCDLFSIEDEITRALQPSVPLKSGGSLVIEQTEAMVTIDVNTGAFVGNRDLEETVFRTNLEAASALARQLRLRNLGGIIVIDFIDMELKDHQRQVIRALEAALEHDKATTIVSEFSKIGLIEMTRKRASESLISALCEPCPECLGSAVVKSAETIGFDLYREVLRRCLKLQPKSILVWVSEQLSEYLQKEGIGLITELEAQLSCTIEKRVESRYSRDQFDIVPLENL